MLLNISYQVYFVKLAEKKFSKIPVVGNCEENNINLLKEHHIFANETQ